MSYQQQSMYGRPGGPVEDPQVASTRRMVLATIAQIDAQIERVEELGRERGLRGIDMMDGNGRYYMIDLVIARANAVLALTNLEKS